MPDNIFCNGCEGCEPDNTVKEAVCINTSRIYDSCSDKDCLEDLPVYLSPAGQCMIDKATSVRLNDAEVCDVSIDLQPVPFHNGFYSVDMTFFFEVCLDVFMAPNAIPMTVKGLSVFSKRAVLFGSCGSVKVFTTEENNRTSETRSCPKATVQVAEPIALSAKLTEHKCSCSLPCHIPDAILSRFGGEFSLNESDKEVLVSIGIFSIIQLERNVQILIPAYDFCVPHKECVSTSENPCDLFSAIEFPTREFFPTDTPSEQMNCGCGCTKQSCDS